MKKRAKVITALALAVTMMASVVGCGGTKSESGGNSGAGQDTLTVSMSGDVGDLSPFSGTRFMSLWLIWVITWK